MVLKNIGIAHVMIVQNKTLPFEVLVFKWYVVIYFKKKKQKDVLSRKYFTCVYFPEGNLKIIF